MENEQIPVVPDVVYKDGYQFVHVTDFEEVWLLYCAGLLWGFGDAFGMIDGGEATNTKESLRKWWAAKVKNGRMRYGPRLEL